MFYPSKFIQALLCAYYICDICDCICKNVRLYAYMGVSGDPLYYIYCIVEVRKLLGLIRESLKNM